MAKAIGELERGRESFAKSAWVDAYASLSAADRAEPLDARTLELLATSAYMLGRDEEWMSCLERAHHLYEGAGEPLRAVRCAFWVGMNLALRGEVGPATGGSLARSACSSAPTVTASSTATCCCR